MSVDIVILEEGYSRWNSDQTMSADATCSLIKTSDELILVDTLGPWAGNKLIKLINKEGFHLEDLTYVVCTHGHSDHVGNLNLFTENTQKMTSSIKNQQNSSEESNLNKRKSKIKKHFVGYTAYHDDKYELDLFKENIFKINENILIRQTPGHTLSCVSVLVNNVNNYGRVSIVGDLFENEKDLNDDQIWKDAGSESEDLQKLNRKFILENCDFIIPGHGNLFKVKK